MGHVTSPDPCSQGCFQVEPTFLGDRPKGLSNTRSAPSQWPSQGCVDSGSLQRPFQVAHGRELKDLNFQATHY